MGCSLTLKGLSGSVNNLCWQVAAQIAPSMLGLAVGTVVQTPERGSSHSHSLSVISIKLWADGTVIYSHWLLRSTLPYPPLSSPPLHSPPLLTLSLLSLTLSPLPLTPLDLPSPCIDGNNFNQGVLPDFGHTQGCSSQLAAPNTTCTKETNCVACRVNINYDCAKWGCSSMT